MSTRSEKDRADGRAILEAWDRYEEEERELGIRLMHLLLFGLTHVTDKEPGRAFDRKLRRVLIDRVSFDMAAKDALSRWIAAQGGSTSRTLRSVATVRQSPTTDLRRGSHWCVAARSPAAFPTSART